jgi:hypothetical protein
LSATARIDAQGVELKQGTRALLTIPPGSFREDTHFSGWSSSMKKTSLDVLVEAAGPGGVAVNGDSAWRVSGFPAFLEIEVKRISYDGGKRRTRVDVKTPLDIEVRLFFGGQQGDAQALFAAVTVAPSAKAAYLRSAYETFAKHFFASGPLSALPDEKQIALVRYAHATAQGAKVGTTIYKDNLYLVVSYGSWSTVYNDLRMDQVQRVSRVLSDRLLSAMKAFGSVVADVPGVYGLKLEVGIPHRPFTRETGTQTDNVEIYTPSADIKRFADADITSQALIDLSVVIVNSNRVEVRFSGS